jgi:imidazole glycerol-phosphate synthase subunit HisH
LITVIDYGRGNLFSLGQALRHLGVQHRISSEAQALAEADRIIFPGVGAFGDASKPLLGICVGCQLLLSRGEEFGEHEGLGILPGTVARLPDPVAGDADAIRIPNVGWRKLQVRTRDGLFAQIGDADWMYFVHSYAPMVDDEADIAATIRVNGRDIPVAIQRDNVVGVQFHPEKSGAAGLALLQRFVSG